jgi:hypothetical protein
VSADSQVAVAGRPGTIIEARDIVKSFGRVVALESAVPLLVVAVVSIGMGFGASAMFASVQLQHPLAAPDAAY